MIVGSADPSIPAPGDARLFALEEIRGAGRSVRGVGGNARGAHERVDRHARPVPDLNIAQHAPGSFNTEAGQLRCHRLWGQQHARFLRSAVPVGQIRDVVADHEQHPILGDRLGSTMQHATTLRAGKVEVQDDDQIERPRGGFPRDDVVRDPVDREPTARASSRARSSATREKSTAVTCQPQSASQRAFLPSPQARSSARPGRSDSVSATRNRFGSGDQSESVAV